MDQQNVTKDVLDFTGEGKPRPSGFLKVITILTIIWCILSLFSSGYSYISAKKTYETNKQMFESGKMDDMPGFVKMMMGKDPVGLYKQMYEKRLPIFIVSLIGIILCFWGAIEMRNLKKQGYMLWLIGEVLPIAAMFFLINSMEFSIGTIIALFFPVLFIIFYTVSRKELIY